jgi:RNA polymerase sigma-70 factor (ECF subfamily)
MREPKTNLIERLFTEHAGSLQEFFRRRLRRQWDAPDLTQEVYIRMLRVTERAAIDNPEAYLFTVANNLLREHAVIARRQEARQAPLGESYNIPELTIESTSEGEIDRDTRARLLHEAMLELPEKLQAIVIWAFDEGLTQEAIAKRLGVSRRMARKHLAAAMEHCRRRLIHKGVR